ncbi:MAG: hypothetical protein KAY24_18320 [Candidatus Eisenbacteria sp.]|nr:hypothetical protein [Candidatus Eisenbacteria bacterium]
MKFAAINLLLAVLLAAAVASVGAAGNTDGPQESDAYEFPVRPGTPEWRTLRTHNEKLQVCQVPEAVLTNMSTYGLAQTCMEYPMLTEILLDICLQGGVDKVVSKFNGLQELLRRPDVGITLYHIYKSTDPLAIDPASPPFEQVSYSIRLAYLELFLAQDESLASLVPKELPKLLATCLECWNAMSTRPKAYGRVTQEAICLLMGRVLLQIPYEPFVERLQGDSQLNTFLSPGCPSGGAYLDTIVESARRYLSREE